MDEGEIGKLVERENMEGREEKEILGKGKEGGRETLDDKGRGRRGWREKELLKERRVTKG